MVAGPCRDAFSCPWPHTPPHLSCCCFPSFQPPAHTARTVCRSCVTVVLTRATLAALCRARTSVTQGTFVCLGPHPPKTKSVVFKSTWAFGGSHCCGVCRSPCAHRSYCPAGSSFPEPIQLGYFGTGSVNPETFSGESPCPPGFYCANALKNPCPVRFACVRLLLGYFPVVRSPPHAALPFPVCVCVCQSRAATTARSQS